MRRAASSFVIALATALPVRPVFAQHRAAEAVGRDELSGAWVGMARHGGDSSLVALEIEPAGTDSALLRLSIPTIHMQRTPVGPVPFRADGDMIVLGPFGFVYERASTTLRGTLPGALVPLYDIPIVLARVERLELPERVALDAPEVAPVWVHETGSPLWAGVTVSDGIVYVGDDSGRLHALDATTGHERWSFRAGGAIRASPTVADRGVFFQADDGYLYRLSGETGAQEWRRRLIDSVPERIPLDDSRSRYDPFASAVTIRRGRLFLGTVDGRVLALDPSSGNLQWTFRANDAVVAAPTDQNGIIFVGSFDHHVYALDHATGALRWAYDTGAPVVSSPAITDRLVIVGSRSYDLLGLDRDTGAEHWKHYLWFSWIESSVALHGGIAYVGSSDANVAIAFDPTDGRELWRTDVFGWAWGTPAVTDERVYVATAGNRAYSAAHRGAVIALDRSTGLPVWQYDPDSSSPSGVFGFPGALTVGDSLVFAAGLDGRVYALRQ